MTRAETACRLADAIAAEVDALPVHLRVAGREYFGRIVSRAGAVARLVCEKEHASSAELQALRKLLKAVRWWAR